MIKDRYLSHFIREDLQKKMVLVGGPRQVGKTTLAKLILRSFENALYYNWDNRLDRKELLAEKWPAGEAAIVLDELHKYRFWKKWIKGAFDKYGHKLHFFITGSARLDIYRKGGDSLQGRYHYYRLHPFSLAEASNHDCKQIPQNELSLSFKGAKDILTALLHFGGFPEPFIEQNEKTLRRWQSERFDRFFREDIRDLENIRDLSSLELMTDMLHERAAQSLSINSLREDLEVSHKAVTHWLQILERLYYIFRIPPYTTKKIRSLRKENKVYLWDWALAPNISERYENMIASHLLKFCHYLQDVEGYRMNLYYLRDIDKREVDFLVTHNAKPWFAVEAKIEDTTPSLALRYFAKRLKIPFLYQVTLNGDPDFVQEGVRVIGARQFLANLA